eukprot:jgi/Hompol1/2119/HPOL_002835-RA
MTMLPLFTKARRRLGRPITSVLLAGGLLLLALWKLSLIQRAPPATDTDADADTTAASHFGLHRGHRPQTNQNTPFMHDALFLRFLDDADPLVVPALSATIEDFHFRSPDPNYIRPKTPYFHEIHNLPHFDSRYFSYTVHRRLRRSGDYYRKGLLPIFSAWAKWADEHGFPYWIAHGTLLGWWWGGEMLPWDDDMDIQVNANIIHELARFNQTLINNRFLLDINPSFTFRPHELRNVIDFRIIDTNTGMFIDGTGLSTFPASYDQATQQINCTLKCKSPHSYPIEQIFPLTRTLFEGVETWRPRSPQPILEKEYQQSTAITLYRGYEFNPIILKWVRAQPRS